MQISGRRTRCMKEQNGVRCTPYQTVRGIEVPHMVKYCGTLETERQEEQRKQIRPK
jgi:hypothetical protein